MTWAGDWRGGRREDEVTRSGGGLMSGPSLGSGQPRSEAGPQHIEVRDTRSVSAGRGDHLQQSSKQSF